MASDWKTTTFEESSIEILDGDRGKNYPKKSEFTESGYCLFLNTGNVTKDGFKFSSTEFVSSERDQLLRKGKLQREDVVLTTRGTVGNVAYYDSSIPFDHIRINSGMVILRSDDTKILPRYLYLFLRSKLFEDQVIALQSGSAQPQLPIRDIKRVEIKVPSVTEQKTIAHILGTLDDKIELNRQMNETLEAMAQALFKSWFVDFDPVIDNALAAGNAIPDALQKKAAERAEQRKGIKKKDHSDIQALFPDEFEFTEDMGWIPKGWGASTLDDLTTELRRGISPKYTEVDGVRVVNQRCIRNHSIDYSVCRLNDESLRKVEGRHLEVGDVVVNSTGVGTLGRMAQVLYLDEPAVVDSHVTIVRPNTELVKPYTFGRLMLSIEPLVESMGLGSTGQTELSRVHLGELVVCVPPIKLQEFVEKSFLSYSDKSAFNIQQNITLAKLRDTLLPKFMSGELRIADAVALVDEAI